MLWSTVLPLFCGNETRELASAITASTSPKLALPDLARIVRGIKLAGAGPARERDQMLGNDPGGDDFLDSTFLQTRPSIAPESPAIVGQHAELPAHLEQHGEAPFQVLEGEL